MSTYQRPIQPFDPVIPDLQPKPPIRYVRDNFQGTGQDSHTLPPTQDSTMWQALGNVMPITKGVIERRWGFAQLASGVTGNRLVSFQRDADGLRTILAQGQGQVQAFNEDGSLYNNNVFAPVGSTVRSLTSRNFQYFFDGFQPDLIKWDGDSTSKWGIDVTDVTANNTGGGTSPTVFGPSGPTVVADLGGAHTWTSPNSIKVTDGVSATVTLSSSVAGTVSSNTLKGTNFSLGVSGGTIAGIVIAVKAKVTGTYLHGTVGIQLQKGGGLYGSAKSTSALTSTLQTFTFGSSSDLWGGTWTVADIAASNFGFQVHASASPEVTPGEINDARGGRTPPTYNLNATLSIDSVAITIYTTAATGTTTTSGSGVGISSIAGGGSATLTIGRTYYLTFFNANTGNFSDLSIPSGNTGATNTATINLLLATSNDPQVTHKYLLATADGGDPSILYKVAELINGGGSDVVTYADTLADTDLLSNQVFLFTDESGSEFGVSLNNPPPPGTLCVKHQGRLWMAGVPGATHSIFFSKGISELSLPNGFVAGKYEECWPAINYFDISDGAESVNALLSDGQSLYIGSQYHVRRLVGDDPTNFQLPQIVHAQVGVINQEVLKLVYTQGSPAGAIWLTPDFRIIQSDFNTYVDIGSKIQDILNNLNPAAASLAHGVFVADGEYDLYILAVPFQQSSYCDLHLVYDLRHQAWFVWAPTNGSLSLLYNVNTIGFPQWLFISSDGKLNQYQANSTTDNGAAFIAYAQSSWLHLGEPSHRKVINELEYDGDPDLLISIDGALLQSHFTTPLALVTDIPSVLGPLGTRKCFVASRAVKGKYFRFTFRSNTIQPLMLGSYNIETFPFNDL